MKIKAIFFDQDETLIRPSTGLYEEYILERAKDFAQTFKIKDIEEAKRLAYKMKKEECGDSTIILYDKMGISRNVWYDKINNIDILKYIKKDTEILKFLKSLTKSGIKIFLLTNSPTLQTEKIFQALRIPLGIFDEVFTWIRDQEPPKPSQKPFIKICKKLKMNHENMIMVGNEVFVDLKPAHNLGVTTVGINPEEGPQKFIDFKISQLTDLYAIINKAEGK
jgi:HAD superfamily hydrolase (TIGR01549 family)